MCCFTRHPQPPSGLLEGSGSGELLSTSIDIAITVNCCIIKRRCSSTAVHGSPVCCISAELSFEWLQNLTLCCSIFLFLLQTTGLRESQETVQGWEGLQEDTALHRDLQRGLFSAPQRAWSCLEALVPKNSELLPERHRNRGLPSSQDAKPPKEAETSQRERQGASGSTEHLHTQGPSVHL